MKSEKTFWAVLALNDPISNELKKDLTMKLNEVVRWNEMKQQWEETSKVYVPAHFVNPYYNNSDLSMQLSKEFLQTKEMKYLFFLLIKGIEENGQILVTSFDHKIEIFDELISTNSQQRLNLIVRNMNKPDDSKKEVYTCIEEEAKKVMSSGIQTSISSKTCSNLLAAYFERIKQLQPVFSYAALLLADYVNQLTGTSWEPQYWGYEPEYWSNSISTTSSYLEMEYASYKSYPLSIFEKDKYQFSIPYYDRFTKKGHMIHFAISEIENNSNKRVSITFIPANRIPLGLNINHIPQAVFNFTTNSISIEDNQRDYSMIV